MEKPLSVVLKITSRFSCGSFKRNFNADLPGFAFILSEMKFTNSFGLTSTLETKQSMTSKEELKAIHKRFLKKLGVNKQYYYGELLTVFRINLSNLLKNYSVQGNLAHLYNFLAIKHLISLFHLYVKSKLTNRN